MKRPYSGKTKKRSRPAAGREPMTTIRLSDDLRTRIDQWAAEENGRLSRSEAIRRLVEMGLAMPARIRRRSKTAIAEASVARKAATRQIEKAQRGRPQSDAMKARRKRRLLEIPDELTGKPTKVGK